MRCARAGAWALALATALLVGACERQLYDPTPPIPNAEGGRLPPLTTPPGARAQSLATPAPDALPPPVQARPGGGLAIEPIGGEAQASPRAQAERIGPLASRAGRGRGRIPGASPAGAAGADGVSLQFEEAPVGQVAGAVLGDMLGRNFIVDSGIEETVTLRTSSPIPRRNLTQVLSVVLASRGLSLAEEAGVYRIYRNGAGPAPTPVRAGAANYRVYPLRYIPAQELRKVLALMVPEDRLVALDGANDVIVAVGDRHELNAIGDAIGSFDVADLSGVTSLLVRLAEADAEDVANELEDIFGFAARAPGRESVRVLSVPRLNAVVVMAKEEALLDKGYEWIQRLDRRQASTGQRLFVFQVQNRRAGDLAASVRDLLGGAGTETREPERRARRQARFDDNLFDPALLAEGGGALDPDFDPTRGEDLLGAQGRAGGGDALAGARVVVDEANNALLISATIRQYRLIRDLLKQLDSTPLQVMIETTIVEVTLGDDLRYGVEYAIRSGKVPGFSDSSVVFSGDQASLPLAPALPGFSFLLGNLATPEIIIEALNRITNLRVLSSPKLVVVDNQKALLQVGDSVPTVVQQTTNTDAVTGGATPSVVVANQIVYRDTGVTLEVTPRVNNGGLINLDIVQEVTDVALTTSSGIDSPTFRQRKLLTSIAIQGGQTIMLGGLIQERREQGRSGVPLLMDVPVLGALASRTTDTAGRTELIALMTPHVIANSADAQNLSKRLQRKFQALSAFDFGDDSLLEHPVTVPR